MRQTLLALTAIVLGVLPASGQGRMTRTTDGQHPATESHMGGPYTRTDGRVARGMPDVVAEGAKVEFVGEFPSTEGPIAAPDGSLLFNEQGRTIRIDKDNKASVFLDIGGSLAFDSKGRIIATQRGKIISIFGSGREAVLADAFNGKLLDRPNDLVVDRKGGVYFTDPGAVPVIGGNHPTYVYYLKPDGNVILLADNIVRANGIQLSPDEKTLYVNDTYGEYVHAFDVLPDGSVRNQRRFARLEGISTPSTGPLEFGAYTTRGLSVDPDTGIRSGADGLAIDSEGRLYVASDAGVQVFSPNGERLGTINTQRSVQNLAFAGPDKKTLYVLGRGGVYKIAMLAQGYQGRAK
ncbi:MAG: hypothetical protein A3F70_06685 [Acidobacteria bacterium RIFCSPLOWO2_12_FULL_67_14]|nr:MAG: hypothetical protein A3F70_06685 [Acidobacteria bacterium RIFCSPLOWO2_12_FULL_67_14]